MIGKPKYNYDDKVEFNIDNKPVKGYIYIVDKYGIWEDNSDVYYDIMSLDETMLYKHIKEPNVRKSN